MRSDCCAMGLALSFLASPLFASEARTGSVCLAPLPKDVQQADRLAFSGGPKRKFAYRFVVEIDENKPVEVPRTEPQLVVDLAFDDTHTVRIFDDGRVVESFRFRFAARGGSPLCLAYTPGYQTWSLERPRAGARWCQCEMAK